MPMWGLVIFLVYACTFVGCNDKLNENSKAGFFTVIVLVSILGALLAWLMG